MHTNLPEISIILYADGATLYLTNRERVVIRNPKYLRSYMKKFFEQMKKEKKDICNIDIQTSGMDMDTINLTIGVTPHKTIHFDDF